MPCLFTLGAVHSCLLCRTRDVTQGCAGGETGDARRCGDASHARTARCVWETCVWKCRTLGRRNVWEALTSAFQWIDGGKCSIRNCLSRRENCSHLIVCLSFIQWLTSTCLFPLPVMDMVFVWWSLSVSVCSYFCPTSTWRSFQFTQPVPLTVSCSMRCPLSF